MSARPKILVTSATGKTGVPTTLQLLEKGFPVRAFVRRRDARGKGAVEPTRVCLTQEPQTRAARLVAPDGSTRSFMR